MTAVLHLILVLSSLLTMLYEGSLCIDGVCSSSDGPTVLFAEKDRGKPFIWMSKHLPLAVAGTLPSHGEMTELFASRVPVALRVNSPSESAPPVRLNLTPKGQSWTSTIAFAEPSPALLLFVQTGNYDLAVTAKDHLNAYLPRVRVDRSEQPLVLDVRLERAPVIRGRVVSRVGGEGVSGVQFTSESGSDLGVSASDGEFVLQTTESLPRQISLRVSGFAPKTIEYRAQIADLGTIFLDRGYTLDVKVEHPTAAAPLPLTVRIRANGASRKPGPVIREIEAETGKRVALTGLPPGPHFLELSGPDSLQRLIKEIDILPVELNEEVVWLEPYMVRGVVTHGDDVLPSARINLRHSVGWSTALVATASGELEGELWQLGDVAATVRGGELTTPFFTMVRLAKADPVYLDIHVPATKIEGHVTDKRGSALPGAPVKVESFSGEVRFAQQTRTDAKGRYEFTGMPIGSHELNVAVEGYLPAKAKVDTKRGDSSVKVDFSLEAGSLVTIRTTRTDGSAVPNPIVALGVSADRFGYERLIHGDASGTAKVPLPKGVASDVYVIAPGGGFAHQVIAAKEDREIVVEVPNGNSMITLLVTDSDGRAATGVGFAARFQGRTMPYATWRFMQTLWGSTMITDSAGRLSFHGIPAGDAEFLPFISAAEVKGLMFANGGSGVQIRTDGRSEYTIAVKVGAGGSGAVAP